VTSVRFGAISAKAARTFFDIKKLFLPEHPGGRAFS
jgi:hypothetical protein